MEYRAVYKCRLCGERYSPGYYDTDLRTVENHMEEMAAGIRGTPLTALVSEKKIHRCADSSLGLADFQGWEAGK